MKILSLLACAFFSIVLPSTASPYCFGCDFVYSHGTFTTLSYPAVSSTTTLLGVSSYGVLGYYSINGVPGQVFVYSNGIYTNLGIAAPENPVGGINDAGNVVIENTIYSPSNSIIGTVTIPGSEFTQGSGINNANAVAGSFFQNGGYHGFLYSGGAAQTVDAPNTDIGELSGINDSGAAVGSGGTASGSLQFIYANGQFTYLSDPAGVATDVAGINNSGNVVGNSIALAGSGQNQIVTSSGFIYNNGVYTTFNVPGATDTKLLGIANNGDIIGVYTLTPEPSTYALVVVAGIAAFARAKRKTML